MLTQVAEGVLVHRSELIANNAVVVRGRAGALLVDPGLTEEEMTCLADDLAAAGQRVAAGFSTHPTGTTCVAPPARRGAPLRDGALRGADAGAAVQR